MKDHFNVNYMERKVTELGRVPFVFPWEGAVAIESVSVKSEWCADELTKAIVDFGTQGERVEINIANYYTPHVYTGGLFLSETFNPYVGDYANCLFWKLHEIIADSQTVNFYHIYHNQMIFVNEYVDAYRKHMAARKANPNCEQCLPFVFCDSYAKELDILPDVQRVQALRRIIKSGVCGIKPAKTRDSKVDDIVFKICASIRHAQKDFMDFLQREDDEKSLFKEFADCPPEEQDLSIEIERLNAFLKRIYDPKHQSMFQSFRFYEDYARTAFNMVGRTSRLSLLHAIMCYGTEGERGLYKINDLEVALSLIPIKASIKASQKRYLKAQINGKKGGRPVKFPQKLFVELAKRGFCSAGEIAAYLECSERTVTRKISDDELYKIMMNQHNRFRSQRKYDKFVSSNPEKDPNVIPLLVNTGVKKFQYLKDRMKQSKKEDS